MPTRIAINSAGYMVIETNNPKIYELSNNCRLVAKYRKEEKAFVIRPWSTENDQGQRGSVFNPNTRDKVYTHTISLLVKKSGVKPFGVTAVDPESITLTDKVMVLRLPEVTNALPKRIRKPSNTSKNFKPEGEVRPTTPLISLREAKAAINHYKDIHKDDMCLWIDKDGYLKVTIEF